MMYEWSQPGAWHAFLYDCCRPEARAIGAAWLIGIYTGAMFMRSFVLRNKPDVLPTVNGRER